MSGRLYDATWGRAFAATYDRFLRSTERAGLAARRSDLVSGARGRTIELGAGSGLNLEHYTDAVGELVLTEPFGPMAKQLRERVEGSSREAEVIEAPAERLPVDDESFDTVVITLVLCTVADPTAVLAEIGRVLRPGGTVLFLEHVRSGDERSARRQDRLHRPWRFVGHSCNCNRDTLGSIEASGLELDEVTHGEMPKAPSIVRPLITGSAHRPVAAS